MKIIDLRNDTKDLDLSERFKAMIEASPRFNVDFKWTDNDESECCFVLSDRDPEEGPDNEHYILRKDISEDPRRIIWDMIKHFPPLYCLDYGTLYLEKIS